MDSMVRCLHQILMSKSKQQVYWKQVLQKVMVVIYLLAECGLGFIEDDETFRLPNDRNLLGLLELIAKFDPFLHTHINQYGTKEVIKLMAKKVL